MLDKTNKSASARLGQSGEDYLEAVLVLGREKVVVRVKDLAERLTVSRPSVVAALAKLERKGLVRHERYGAVELTGAGTKLAESIDGRHRLLFFFLHETLGLPAGRAAKDACALEHALSAETTATLLRFVDGQRRSKPAGSAKRGRRP